MDAHYEDPSIRIDRIKCGPYDNNAYLIVSPDTNESVILDTPAEPDALIEAAQGTTVRYILITHNHMDHLLGFEDVTSAIACPVGIGEADAPALSEATRTAATRRR